MFVLRKMRKKLCLVLVCLMLLTAVPVDALTSAAREEKFAAFDTESMIVTPETGEYSTPTGTNVLETAQSAHDCAGCTSTHQVGGYSIPSSEMVHKRDGYTLNDIRAMLQQGYAGGFERVYRPDSGPITYQTPAEELVEFFDALIPDNDMQAFNAFTYPVRPIIGEGRPCNESIVLVLLGDGFIAGHGYGQVGNHQNPAAGTFLHSAHEFATTITTLYPFSLFSDLFKIYAVESPSTHSGIRVGGSPYGPYPGTYFGSYFRAPWDITMTVEGRAHALNISNWVCSNAIMTQVIANSRVGGGRAFWSWADYANTHTVGISSRFLSATILGWDRPAYHYTVVHETGHNFGQLVDEHATGFGAPNHANANMARTTDTNEQLKWGHWLGHAGIIRRTEDAPAGYIFPSTNRTCKMQGWHFGFCRVCSAELTRRMAMISGETFEAGRRPDGSVRPATPNVTATSQHNRILPYAFHGNRSLQTITIPASVTEIGNFAFIGATGLRTIHNNRRTPQEINYTTFAGLDRGRIDVMIPNGTSQAFANAGWTNFRLIEPDNNVSIWKELSFVMNDLDPPFSTPRTINPINVRVGANILEFLHDNHDGFTRFPRRAGHRIAGWYTDASLQTRLTSTTTMPASDFTLYVRWESAYTPRFTDVDQLHWSHDSIQAISDAGIMQGIRHRIFDPLNSSSRAQFAAVLGRTHGVVTGDGFPDGVYANYNIGLRFSDMGTDSRFGWSNQYVAWASDSRDIITGFTDGTFRPGANITREQAATLLFRYETYRLGGHAPVLRNPAILNNFPDRGEVSSWAEAGMAWAVENRIIQGRDVAGESRLLPNNNVLRQETAAMIYRYLGSDNVGLLHLLDEAAGSPLALAVSLGEAVHTFPSVPIGHDSQVAHTITIDNIGIRPTGALTIFLSGENADSFTLSATTLASVPSGDTINLTVWSNSGLAAGTHTATVTVYGINLMPQSIELTIEVGVDPPPPPTEFSGTSPAQLNALLAEGDVKLTTPTSGGFGIAAHNTLIIPEGRTLYVEGALNVRRHGTLIIEGTVVVLENGRINNDGHSTLGGGTIEITEYGRLINYGYIENISNSYVFNYGKITNNGRFEVRANTTFINSGVVDGSHPLRIHRDAILQN